MNLFAISSLLSSYCNISLNDFLLIIGLFCFITVSLTPGSAVSSKLLQSSSAEQSTAKSTTTETAEYTNASISDESLFDGGDAYNGALNLNEYRITPPM